MTTTCPIRDEIDLRDLRTVGVVRHRRGGARAGAETCNQADRPHPMPRAHAARPVSIGPHDPFSPVFGVGTNQPTVL